MYNFALRGNLPLIDFEELLKLFFPAGAFSLVREGENPAPDRLFLYEGDKNKLKREMFRFAEGLTGLRPPWGILTGIRPLKLAGELRRSLGSEAAALEFLEQEYLVTREKALELFSILRTQAQAAGPPPADSVAVYLGIPFCPSRCAYCSFATGTGEPALMAEYLEALLAEIRFVGRRMRDLGWRAESVYIGGGTPTSYGAPELSRLLYAIRNEFAGPDLRELTLEGGRPDTLDRTGLEAAAALGVTRLSINPQSMKQSTLDRIGRMHAVQEIPEKLRMAKDAGIPIVNMDLIAGLPGETLADFADTLDQVLPLRPENLTLHCLAVKRAARLRQEEGEIHFSQAVEATKMLALGRERLIAENYRPYYLYRQKQMAGGNENTGYALPGTEGIYNIRIMEENQTILALGAGGISKAYFPAENRLERAANVADARLYLKRFDEMLERKNELIFRRYETC